MSAPGCCFLLALRFRPIYEREGWRGDNDAATGESETESRCEFVIINISIPDVCKCVNIRREHVGVKH